MEKLYFKMCSIIPEFDPTMIEDDLAHKKQSVVLKLGHRCRVPDDRCGLNNGVNNSYDAFGICE